MRKKIISEYIKNDLENAVKDEVFLKAKINNKKLVRIRFNVLLDGISYKRFYDIEDREETSEDTLVGSCNIDYSDDKKGFVINKQIAHFNGNYQNQVLFMNDDVLYVSTFRIVYKAFFPSNTGIPDDECIKNAVINKQLRFEGIGYAYDIKNDMCYICCFSKNNPELYTFDEFYDKEKKSIKSFRKEIFSGSLFNHATIFTDSCNEFFYQDEKSINALDFLRNKVKTIIANMEEKFSKLPYINDEKIKKLIEDMSIKKDGIFIKKKIDNKIYYEITCPFCGSKKIITDKDIYSVVYYKNELAALKTECPICHQSHYFLDIEGFKVYNKIFLSLDDEKNILIVKSRFDTFRNVNELVSVNVIKNDSVNLVYRENKNSDAFPFIYLNSDQEFIDIFDNSNIANIDIPKIIGIRDKSPNKEIEIRKIFDFSNSFSRKNLLLVLIKYPFLKETVLRYDSSFIDIVLNYIYECGTNSEEYNDIDGLIGLPSNSFDTLVKNNMLSVKIINKLRKISKIRDDKDIFMIIDYLKNQFIGTHEHEIVCSHIINILNARENISVKELCDYTISCSLNQDISKEKCLEYLMKIIFFKKALGDKQENKRQLFPTALKKQFAVVSNEYFLKKGNELFLSKEYQDSFRYFEYEGTDYSVRLAKNAKEIVEQGHRFVLYPNDNINSFNLENPVVCVLVKNSDPDTPLYGISIIIGFHKIDIFNKYLQNPTSQKILDFISSWENHIFQNRVRIV